jgi:hypothetical protein
MLTRQLEQRFSWRRLRFVPIVIGVAAFALGLATGLVRLGWQLPIATDVLSHGPLMACGFFGTMISLERAVALGSPWHYAAPALSAAGANALLLGSASLASVLFLSAAILLMLSSMILFLRMPALFIGLLAVAAGCWVIGNALWMRGDPLAAASGWWVAFLILTIAAERLELSRLLSPSAARQAILIAAVALVLVGAARSELASLPAIIFGSGMIVLAAWLFDNDIARRTIRGGGQVRFTATCMLAGYAWLAIAGAILVVTAGRLSYDAAIHAVTIGFVLSVVFGHAPIIVPGITGLRIAFHVYAYAALAILEGSALLRLAGDFSESGNLRMMSGIVAIVALAGYAGVLVVASCRPKA